MDGANMSRPCFTKAIHTIAKIGQARGYGPMGRFDDRPHMWFFMTPAHTIGGERNRSSLADIILGIDRLVFFVGTEKLNIDSLREIVQTMEALALTKVMIIYQTTITASVRKAMEHLIPIQVELWKVAELMYDIREHKLFCVHTKLGAQDIANLVNGLSGGEGVAADRGAGTTVQDRTTSVLQKLPKILKSDPVVRFFGFQRGDVLRIQRPSGSFFFRIVR